MRILTILIISLVSFALQAQSLRVPRVNEAGQDPSLQSFISEIKRSIAYKDHGWLRSVMADDIQFSTDEDGSIADFARRYEISSPTSPFWDCLDRVVSLGGIFLQSDEATALRQFVMPYTYGLELENPMDYYNSLVITGSGVNVREEPNLTSRVLGGLSYEVVWVDMDKSADPESNKLLPCEPKEWYFVESFDKRISGYVYWKFVFSPAGYRLILHKESGNWQIKAFLIGE